ncbi:MAG: M48 family metallopeptidase [Candidatus Schekmanbacteria bacterium]|nr:M48 family metallopeptidase [Candidatus Schekmanbacteria bacterium]
MQGKLFGRTAAGGESCEVSVAGACLQAEHEEQTVRFPAESSRLSIGGTNGCMFVLEKDGASGTVSLYLDRPQSRQLLLAAGFAARLAELESAHSAVRARWAGVAVLVVAACLALAFAVNKVADLVLVSAVQQVPLSWESKLGATMMSGVLATATEVSQREVTAAVETVVSRLKGALEPPRDDIAVHVLRDDEVNAFALPGGQIVLNTALVASCERPEELAGVLAHEMQHILLRHSLQSIAEKMKWSILLSLVIGDFDSVQAAILGGAAGLARLGHSRDMEREADRQGLLLLHRANIDPEGMVDFFARLGAANRPESSALLSFASTHPGDEERVSYLQAEIAGLGERTVEPLAIDWETMRRMLKEGSS